MSLITNDNGDDHEVSRDRGNRLTQIETVVAQNTRQISQLTGAISDLRDVSSHLVNAHQENRTAINQLATNQRELQQIISSHLVEVNQDRTAINQLATNQRELQQLVQQIALSQVNLNEVVIPQLAEQVSEMTEQVRTTSAGLEQLERTVDYLMRRDQEQK